MLGAREAADGVEAFSDETTWDVLEEIPNDSAAALVLLEHHWAVPLRDAVARAGGYRISDGFISPLDLVEVGLLSADEAAALHARETAASVASKSTNLLVEVRIRWSCSRGVLALREDHAAKVGGMSSPAVLRKSFDRDDAIAIGS